MNGNVIDAEYADISLSGLREVPSHSLPVLYQGQAQQRQGRSIQVGNFSIDPGVLAHADMALSPQARSNTALVTITQPQHQASVGHACTANLQQKYAAETARADAVLIELKRLEGIRRAWMSKTAKWMGLPADQVFRNAVDLRGCRERYATWLSQARGLRQTIADAEIDGDTALSEKSRELLVKHMQNQRKNTVDFIADRIMRSGLGQSKQNANIEAVEVQVYGS